MPVIAVIVIRWRNSLVTWSVIATMIWVLGTWKFYPFALGIILIPVLFIRRGWVVLLGFATASAIFLLANSQSILTSSRGNSYALVIFDFPATGRLPIVARLMRDFTPDANPLIPNLLVGVLAVLAVTWGWFAARDLEFGERGIGMLAAGGSLVFLASTFVAGFGYAYKNAFLLLLIPLLSLAGRSKSTATVYSFLCMLALIVIALVTGYSILLASLASLLAASFGFGASMCFLLRRRLTPRSKDEALAERIN
jgi:hypothetical protein